MKIIIPNNLFATILILSMEENANHEIIVRDSPLIQNELNSDDSSVALMPSMNLIQNRDLYVSSKIGIAFDGPLSNSYMYFAENGQLDKFLLKGDTSSNEAILSKIVLQERYDITPEISLDTNDEIKKDMNYIVTGNDNWNNNLHKKGISFSEQVSEIIDAPYQNFIFASTNKSSLEKINELFADCEKIIDSKLIDILDRINFDNELNSKITQELDFVYFHTKAYENSGLSQLIKLAYYHQILDDLFDIKFV